MRNVLELALSVVLCFVVAPILLATIILVPFWPILLLAWLFLK